jgi:toxin ParE1/3/4
MSGRVLVRPAAEDDLADQARHLARRNAQLAVRFLEAAERAFEHLAAMPLIGTPRRFRSSHLRGLRSWPLKGFERVLVFYLPLEDGIDVLRVLHGARDLGSFFDE